MERRFRKYVQADLDEVKARKVPTVEVRSRAEARAELPRCTFRFYHNFRFDPELRPDELMLRRWPCACVPCVEQLDQESRGRRYARPACVYAPVFEGLNDWRKIDLKISDQDAGEDDQEAFDHDAEVCFEEAQTRARVIVPFTHGAVAVDNDRTHAPDGYYVVQFTSEAYALTEDTDLKDYGLKQEGTIVVDALWLNKVPGLPAQHRWFTPFQAGDDNAKITLPADLVVHVNMDLMLATGSLIPRGRGRGKACDAVKAGAVVVSAGDHDEIVEQLAYREERASSG